MKRFEGEQGRKEFQDRIDAELRHLTLSTVSKHRIRAVATQRPESLVERVSQFLDREIVVTLPQLSAGLAVFAVALGLYWYQLLGVDDEIRAQYQIRETVVFTSNGGVLGL